MTPVCVCMCSTAEAFVVDCRFYQWTKERIACLIFCAGSVRLQDASKLIQTAKEICGGRRSSHSGPKQCSRCRAWPPSHGGNAFHSTLAWCVTFFSLS